MNIEKEELDKIRSLDLLTYFINYDPDELIRLGNHAYKTKTHSSLHLSNGLWHYFAKGIGGRSALDYFINVEGYTFKDAYMHLKECIKDGMPQLMNYPKNTRNKFVLPDRHTDNKRVIEYLNKERCIDLRIIQWCIDNQLIYEDKDHHVVFVGYDQNNTARFATMRAIDSSIKKDCIGSIKKYSFSISSDSEILHVFESGIDLLSYLTLCLYKNKHTEHHYLSLSGVSGLSAPALDYYLSQHPSIKVIYLHLDNDEAGHYTTKKIMDRLGVLYCVIDQSSIYKDVNDELCEYIKLIHII